MNKQQTTPVPDLRQEGHLLPLSEQPISPIHRSPLRLLIVTIVAIFVAEVVAMVAVYALGSIPYYLTTVVDAGIMTILIFPVLYYLSFRPLISQMEKSWQAENRLRRVNRTLFVLNECNQALVHAEEENEFLQRMCEIIVNIGEYRMAWIGFAEHDQSRNVQPAAQFGFENGYLEHAQITWADDQRGQGPTGTAIRQGAVQVNQNFLTNPKMAPWRESAVMRGYQSSIALPLQNENLTFGALTIYSASPDAFDAEEVHLLKELANDLAFGITALRVRAERNQAEELNRQLSRIVDQTEDTVVVTNCQGVIEYVNPAFERLTGYTKEETLGKTPRVLKSGFHDSDFYQELWNTILRGDVFQSEVANRKKNGELFYEVKTITPLRDPQGNITHFVATGKDITEHKQDEEKLQKAYAELELRVQERTEQLRVANAELEDEVRIRREAEEALRQSEFGLKRAQEIAHLGNWELDLPNNRLTWSDEVYRIFGLQPQEFQATYESFLEAVHPDDRAAVDLAYSNSVRDGKDGYEIEHRVIRRPDGEIRVVHEKCEHFRNNAGQIIRSVGMVHDITARKRAEEQLERSNQKLNEILESIQDDFYVLGHDWNFVFTNKSFPSRIGKEPKDLIGNNIWRMFPKHLGTTFEENLRAAMEKRETRRFEIPGQYTDAWYRMQVFPSREGITVLGTDITERKRAEKQLRYQAALLSNVNDAIVASDAEFRITAWNAAAEALYGWKAEEVMGRNGLEIVRTEWSEKDPQEMRRAIAETGRWRGEATQARKDGSRFPVEVSSMVLRDESGHIAGYISVNRDITERKQTEEILQKIYAGLEQRVQERTEELAAANQALVKEITERKEIERQLRIQTTAMEAAASGIVITDRHGNIQWTNPAMMLISGYDGRDLIGQSMHIFSSGQHDTDYYRHLWNTILSGQVWRGETINCHKDGSIYIEEQTITPIQSEQGVITHFIAIKQDITERKEAEAELQRRNQELQALSIAEHKQRQLAETLRSSAQALAQTLDLDAVIRTFLQHVRSLVKSDTASMMLLEGESLLVVRAVEGFDAWIQAEQLLPFKVNIENNPLYQKLMRARTSLLLPDITQQPSWKMYPGTEQILNWLFVPIVIEERVIGVVGLGKLHANYFTEEHIQWIEALVGPAAVAIQNAWLFEQVQASTERLHSLSRRLVEVQENERLYISRELHDEAGQVLTSLMVDLRLLEKNTSDPAILSKIIAEMERSLNAVSENLHRVAMALRPASLDHLGLVAALRQYTESLKEKSGLEISFRASETVERLSANVETVLYRIIQEALTNVIRYAHATRADVVLTMRDGKLIVIIEDDGVGFDPETVNTGEHLGLFGMRERAEMIGGKLMVESAPGKGTTIIMEVNNADTVIGRG